MLDPSSTPTHLGFLWDTLRKTVTLPKDKTTRVEAWAKKLLAHNKTTQENLECFVGTHINTTPAVWKAPLHYRALQRSLIISLRGGRSKFKSVRNSHSSVVRELNWWASAPLPSRNSLHSKNGVKSVLTNFFVWPSLCKMSNISKLTLLGIIREKYIFCLIFYD